MIGLLVLASRGDNASTSSAGPQPETEELIQAVIEQNPTAPSMAFSSDKEIDFYNCKTRVDATAEAHSMPTSTVMDTDLIYMVRFPMAEGSVLASCSYNDNKLVVTRSPDS